MIYPDWWPASGKSMGNIHGIHDGHGGFVCERPMIVEIFRPWLFSRSRTEWWLGLGKQNREIHHVHPQARCIDFYHPQMARYISGEWKIITYPEKSMLSMGEHRWIFHGNSWMDLWMDLWMFILPYGPFIRYPLVNVYITVENHHF